jgi:hypothetical protein
MSNPADASRRRVGIFFLAAAGAMLVLGLTLLAGRLRGAGFVVYWLVCFLLTGLAMLTALLDLFIVRHRQREEQRELIVRTIEDLETGAKEKAGRKHADPRRKRR